jgi:hypothetical protein
MNLKRIYRKGLRRLGICKLLSKLLFKIEQGDMPFMWEYDKLKEYIETKKGLCLKSTPPQRFF